MLGILKYFIRIHMNSREGILSNSREFFVIPTNSAHGSGAVVPKPPPFDRGPSGPVRSAPFAPVASAQPSEGLPGDC